MIHFPDTSVYFAAMMSPVWLEYKATGTPRGPGVLFANEDLLGVKFRQIRDWKV